MSNKCLFCLRYMTILFMAVNIFIYGCGISNISGHKAAPTPEKALSTDAEAENEETYEMPEDHAAYSSSMCVMCHQLTSLSESHQHVHEDECLDCHQLAK